MTRREERFDAMLRHLGATYYKTVRGGATASDVARALESVEAEDGRRDELAGSRRAGKTGRWRVSDVMTTDVVTVDKAASCKQVARRPRPLARRPPVPELSRRMRPRCRARPRRLG